VNLVRLMPIFSITMVALLTSGFKYDDFGGRSFDEIKKSGVLKVATRHRDGVSIKDPSGEPKGFQLCLVSEFAKKNKLKLEVEWRPFTFKYYFAKNGEYDEAKAKDETTTYTTDVLKKADIAVDGFSKLPWREKFGRFIQVSTSRQMIIFNKTKMAKPTTIEDLKGRTVYVRPGTIQEDLAKEIAVKVPITIKHYLQNALESETTSELEPLKSGKADFMIYASSYLLVDSRGIPNLDFGLAIGKVDGAHWMVARQNTSLETALTKYIAAAQADGSYNRCWKENYGLDYDSYIRNLSILSDTDESGPKSAPAK